MSVGSKISDIVQMDGVGLSQAIKSKQVSCVEVMTAYSTTSTSSTHA